MCEILWPPLIPACFFLTPLCLQLEKPWPPTEHFPDNLEENLHVKMVLIVEKARFAMAIGLSILHSSVLKMRPKIRKICLRHFHKFGQASSCNCISCHVRLPMLKRLSIDFLTYTYFISSFSVQVVI